MLQELPTSNPGPALVPAAPLAKEFMLDSDGNTYTRWVLFALGERASEGEWTLLDTEQSCDASRTSLGITSCNKLDK